MGKLRSDEERLLFLSKSIRSKEDKDFLQFITELDLKLTDLRSKFKENDESIQAILKRREAAIDSFIKETYQVLKAKKSQAEATLIAVKRPEGVLLEYAALLDESTRDLSIMRRLEDQLRILLLEQARATDPWELITEPTLMEDPILSNKKVLLLSLISGIFFGSIVALIRDRRKDLIYSENELINIMGARPTLRIKAEEKSHWNESLVILSKIINEKETKVNSALLIAGDISENYLKQLDADLNKKILDNKAILTKEYFNFEEYNKKFILIQKGAITRKRLSEILDNLNLLTEDLDGWILLI